MSSQPSESLTGEIIRCAIQVHRQLGPGLLESIYSECLGLELRESGHAVAREKAFPVIYRGKRLRGTFKADLIVDDQVLIELKAVEQILPVHEAQVLSYLKLSGHRVGLLLNFNAPTLVGGLRRFVA